MGIIQAKKRLAPSLKKGLKDLNCNESKKSWPVWEENDLTL